MGYEIARGLAMTPLTGDGVVSSCVSGKKTPIPSVPLDELLTPKKQGIFTIIHPCTGMPDKAGCEAQVSLTTSEHFLGQKHFLPEAD